MQLRAHRLRCRRRTAFPRSDFLRFSADRRVFISENNIIIITIAQQE